MIFILMSWSSKTKIKILEKYRFGNFQKESMIGNLELRIIFPFYINRMHYLDSNILYEHFILQSVEKNRSN